MQPQPRGRPVAAELLQLDADGLAAVEARILLAATVIAAAEFEGAVELEQFGGYGTTPRLRLHRVRAVSSD